MVPLKPNFGFTKRSLRLQMKAAQILEIEVLILPKCASDSTKFMAFLIPSQYNCKRCAKPHILHSVSSQFRELGIPLRISFASLIRF